MRLLAPVLPSKVVCIGKNYADHVAEMGGGETPPDPIVFLKPSTSVIGPGEPVRLPPGAPRPRVSLPPQPRATGAGAHPVVRPIPDAAWRQMTGRSWHDGCPVGRSGLRLLRVNYWGYDGYRYRGEVVAAWIHDPTGEDTLVAARGQGAWLAGPDGGRGEPLRVAPPVPVSGMVGCVSYGYLAEPLKSRVASRLPKLAKTWQLGCAAHEYRLLAGGHIHLSLYNRLMPWDHAPGWLIHRECGGYAAK